MSSKLFLVFLIFLLSGSVILATDDVDLRRPIDVFQVQSSSSYSDCGVANVNASGKIYGGNETAPNEFPWQALLLVDKSISGRNSSEFCEGALIGDRWILTSASCMAVQTG
jgi:secreted trypsin-like serine protease